MLRFGDALAPWWLGVIMRIYFTRDSVCAGDDSDAPHVCEIELPPSDDVEAISCAVLKTAPLPSISGGRATWCVSSRIPLAVIAQEWDVPRMLSALPAKRGDLDFNVDTLRFHFSYFAQEDSEIVFAILRRLRVKAS